MAKDLSHLSGGNVWPPDRPAELGKLMFGGWLDTLEGEETKAKAADTIMRGSTAGMCTRRLWLAIDDDRFDATPADRWRMGLGTLVHEHVEQVMIPKLLAMRKDVWLEVEVEPKYDLIDQGVSVSGHGDLKVLDADGHIGTVEIKTVNGYKFKERAFNWNGGPKGPESYHVRQLGLEMQGLDADWGAVIYVSMENMGPAMLASAGKDQGIQLEDWDRFLAEWVFSREELQPVIDDEMRRMRLVTKAHETGHTAGQIPRVVVVDGPTIGGRNVTITEPKNKAKAPWEIRDTEGELLEVGETWQCQYCPFFDECVEAGDPA